MTRNQLKEIIKADHCRQTFISRLRMRLTFNDNFRLVQLVRALRYTEFYSVRSSVWSKWLYAYWLLRLRYLRIKTGIMLFPHTISEGLYLVHPGFRRIDRFVKIGRNCIILPMVLFGRKRPTDVYSDIIIGDKCYISTGVTILGPVTIGNNVTIGAGAVVTKDIPDNVVVGGIPAQILKYKNTNNIIGD